MRKNPLLFETNTRLFLRRLSQQLARPVSLADVPAEEWERLARLGFDAVWLMGVWRRSPGGRREALERPALRREYDESLPGWSEDDVEGSPYAIQEYDVDPSLGPLDSLRTVRERLHAAGLALIVDFVPNHLALDHPWTASHPQRFVQVPSERVGEHPDWSFQGPSGRRFAHGRDPYFGPWTDTVQVDFFSEDLRGALIGELLRIAEVADGVRCDMAMLALSDVFQWLWGDYSPHPREAEEFWARAIPAVTALHPEFVFLAEAYWGHEPRLQELGFDYTYDKTLYDRLRDGDAGGVQAHLAGQQAHGRWARFIENHDEGRAAAVFGVERGRAAAVVAATLPGLRLFYDGQMEGQRVKTPVQLVRRPDEPVDHENVAFYQRLLSACSVPVMHDGDWRLLDVHPPPGQSDPHWPLLAWQWRQGNDSRLIVVNYSDSPASGLVEPPSSIAAWRDDLSAEAPQGQGSGNLLARGDDGRLRLSLAPWHASLLAPAR